MKIVEINTVHYGSTGKIMLQIADLAREQGHEAHTFSRAWKRQTLPSQYHSFFGSYLENGLHRFIAPITGKEGFYSKHGTKRLIRKLKEIDPDVIHLHNIHGFYINLPLLFEYIKSSRAKIVWTMHDCWAFTGHCPYFDIVECDKWKTECFDCPQYNKYPMCNFDNSKQMHENKKEWFSGIKNLTIVTPSKWLASAVKASCLKDYPVVVIPDGIDLEVFKPTESRLRQEYGIENKHVVLGVAFGWGERKGLDVFVELSKRLDSSYQIVLVGVSKAVKEALPEGIIALPLTHSQKELAELYTMADVFVNPTREETLGLVNVEALACGTPVITFNTGGSPECISDSCGVVVEKNDIDKMEKEIKRICTDKPFTQSSCVEWAMQFNKDEKYKEYIKLYGQNNY